MGSHVLPVLEYMCIVYCILELVQAGITFEEIIKNYYPDISFDDIKACIQYAVDIVKSEEVHIGEA